MLPPSHREGSMARDNVVVDRLKQVPLFSACSSRELRAIAGVVKEVDHPKGTVIAREGDPGVGLFVIVDGDAEVTIGGKRMARLSQGDFFGEIALLDGGPRSASVVAVEPVETASLSRDDFLGLLRRNPAAVEGLLVMLARTIRRLSDEVGDFVFLDQQGRLAKKLLELAETHGRRGDGHEVEIGVPLTQDELATMIGATRARVNVLLGLFEARGTIVRGRRKIVIRDPAALRRWATF